MIVGTKVESIVNINIEPYEAFRILCKTLNMEFVLNEDVDYFVSEDLNGDNCVYRTLDGEDKCFDYRGDLFVALRNVAVNIFPNVSFRNAGYIYCNRGLEQEDR